MRKYAILLAAGLLLAACSSQEASPSDASSPAAPVSGSSYVTSQCAITGGSPVDSESAPTRGTTVAGVTVEDTDLAPVITVAPALPAATEVIAKTLSSGKGQAMTATDTITFNYCGVGLVSQQQFDSSWANGAPITYPLSQLIPGWGQGMPGMKLGEERLLIIPGAAGYGSNPPAGSGILPDESLAFVVQLISIEN
ncbi:MAG: FKBP-type peptidyl-prolyl cis-trans isomerase [Actinomycetota bacterium]|nr:FKBP-type peptidyl-prolyl cis-trans isomerase [Actinomycetota bacterium]